MKKSQKSFSIRIAVSAVVLLIITCALYFDASLALAQVNTTDNITCRLKINGLCYNDPYIKNVNNTAQIKDFDPNAPSVVLSEPANQPKSYTHGSQVTRKFLVHNNLGRVVNVSLRAEFYPLADIAYGMAVGNGNLTQILLQGYIINLGLNETKEISITIPTDQQTLSANVRLSLGDADNPNVGISYAYFSQPFSIYDSSRQTATCQEYTIPTNIGSYACTSDVFIPLGTIGCVSSDPHRSNQECLNNHWYPATAPRNRSPKDIKMLATTIYLTNDQNAIATNEQMITGELSKFRSKAKAIKIQVGLEGSMTFDQKVCTASQNAIRDFLQNEDYGTLSSHVDALLSLCGLSRASYTHVLLNFYTQGVSNADYQLITKAAWGNAVGQAMYQGDGIIISKLNSGDWPIVLHEITHSFGAPDLYKQVGATGSTYIWGDCFLMRTDIPDFILNNTQLCPLENLYWGAADVGKTQPTVTPSASIINSGGSVKMKFTFPTNTVRSSLYLSCPSGVIGAYDNICNKFIDVTSNSDYTATFLNNSSKTLNVVPNYYVYRSTNPNYAIGVSSQIAVRPISIPSSILSPTYLPAPTAPTYNTSPIPSSAVSPTPTTPRPSSTASPSPIPPASSMIGNISFTAIIMNAINGFLNFNK